MKIRAGENYQMPYDPEVVLPVYGPEVVLSGPEVVLDY